MVDYQFIFLCTFTKMSNKEAYNLTVLIKSKVAVKLRMHLLSNFISHRWIIHFIALSLLKLIFPPKCHFVPLWIAWSRSWPAHAARKIFFRPHGPRATLCPPFLYFWYYDKVQSRWPLKSPSGHMPTKNNPYCAYDTGATSELHAGRAGPQARRLPAGWPAGAGRVLLSACGLCGPSFFVAGLRPALSPQQARTISDSTEFIIHEWKIFTKY